MSNVQIHTAYLRSSGKEASSSQLRKEYAFLLPPLLPSSIMNPEDVPKWGAIAIPHAPNPTVPLNFLLTIINPTVLEGESLSGPLILCITSW
jgi:hypothetical protein